MNKRESAWVVVYMAPKREDAERTRNTLAREGFLARTHPEGSESASGAFEVMCLRSEAREARTFLTENGFA